jgi:hypothetical protein
MSQKSKSIRKGGAQTRRSLRKGYKYPVSIHSAAEKLGCNPSHLRKVIAGERDSASLLARYNALKAA